VAGKEAKQPTDKERTIRPRKEAKNKGKTEKEAKTSTKNR
jgi:hypothetical protein